MAGTLQHVPSGTLQHLLLPYPCGFPTLCLHLLPTFIIRAVRVWDIRPFVSANSDRQLKIFRGNRHGFEKVGVWALEAAGN